MGVEIHGERQAVFLSKQEQPKLTPPLCNLYAIYTLRGKTSSNVLLFLKCHLNCYAVLPYKVTPRCHVNKLTRSNVNKMTLILKTRLPIKKIDINKSTAKQVITHILCTFSSECNYYKTHYTQELQWEKQELMHENSVICQK